MTAKPTIFISYNHKSTLADDLEKQLNPIANVKLDKISMKAWESIRKFMDSIRDQDFAVLIISDNFLKSVNCMYEVLQLIKNKNWDEHAMFVVEDDAVGIYDESIQLDYVGYWETKEKQLSDKLKQHDIANTTPQAIKYRKIREILLHIGEFLDKIADANNPSAADAVEAVVKRVSEFPGKPAESSEEEFDELDKQILRSISAGNTSTSEIMKSVDKSRSCINRHIQKLIKFGKIESTGPLQRRKLSLTVGADLQ